MFACSLAKQVEGTREKTLRASPLPLFFKHSPAPFFFLHSYFVRRQHWAVSPAPLNYHFHLLPRYPPSTNPTSPVLDPPRVQDWRWKLQRAGEPGVPCICVSCLWPQHSSLTGWVEVPVLESVQLLSSSPASTSGPCHCPSIPGLENCRRVKD